MVVFVNSKTPPTSGLRAAWGSIIRNEELLSSLIGAERAIVHTRLATTGAVVKQNSHPLVAGKITGVHNGVVLNHRGLNDHYSRQYSVDSHHIFAHIDAGLGLDDIDGYGAVAYIDSSSPGVLYVARFNGGQLKLAWIFDNNYDEAGVIFASTQEAVEGACELAEVNYAMAELTSDQITTIVDGDIVPTGKELNVGFGCYSYYDFSSVEARSNTPVTKNVYSDDCCVECDCPWIEHDEQTLECRCGICPLHSLGSESSRYTEFARECISGAVLGLVTQW